jgi:leucyl/phenylalanyl-tRNA---protein transferase
MPNLLAPDQLLTAYSIGIFPMADDTGELHWLAPDPRCIIELDAFKISRSLRSAIARNVFDVTVDESFEDVIDACADRPDGTWISPEIRSAYVALHRLGFAHSVESRQESRLVGGLYGVAIGGAFFGESMFHYETDASKVALAALVRRMQDRGYVLLDIQFMTEHLRQFGAIEIPRTDYETRLEAAVGMGCAFVGDEPRDDR